ncbi:MAG: hypothetical protein ACFE94_00405 [Candidatus Hodarchaeota archaeon]
MTKSSDIPSKLFLPSQINASINIRSKGIEILKKNHIKIIKNNDRTVGTTGFAFRENVRLINQQFLRKEEATCL